MAEKRERMGLRPGQLDPQTSEIGHRMRELAGRKAYLRNFWYAAGGCCAPQPWGHASLPHLPHVLGYSPVLMNLAAWAPAAPLLVAGSPFCIAKERLDAARPFTAVLCL